MLLALIGITNFCMSQSKKVKEKDVTKLAKAMSGEFSSEEQSKEDTSFFNVKLRMKAFKHDVKSEYWLYVEQAIAAREDKPYRQRVYHLYILNDTTIVSKVYEIKSPANYIGAWKDDTKLHQLSIDSLIDRQGCGIFLHKKNDGIYSGSTPGKECLSSLRGANYATSEVSIYPDKIVSWDRGWDKNDKQVWGAVKSGYIFKKKAAFILE